MTAAAHSSAHHDPHPANNPQSPFMCTTKKPELETHVTNKHPKETFAKCFPMVQ